MSELDNDTFDRILKLSGMFHEHRDQDNREVSWEEMKAEIEELSETEMEILLGLVKTRKKADNLVSSFLE